MKKSSGNGLIFAGSVLELLIGLFDAVIVVLYLTNASPEFMKQFGFTTIEGFKAVFGFYGCTAIHLLVGIIALICKNKPNCAVLIILMGVLLIAVNYFFTDWSTVQTLSVGLSTLPGALLAGGGLITLRTK